MKKNSKKLDLVKVIGGGLSLVGFILLVIGAFLTRNAKIILDVIGYCLFIAGGSIFTFRTKEHTLAKMILFFIIAAIMLTWVLPYGYFDGIDFYDYGLLRIGLADVGLVLHSTLNWILEEVVFLFVVAAFYGVMSQTNGYKKLVHTLAKKFKKHTLIVALCISFIITVLTSLFTDTFAMFIIVPFFVAILLAMNVDKLTTFAVTFGSMLIGVLGGTYGTTALINFNSRFNLTSSTFGIEYRLIILLVAFFLFNFFTCMRLKKVVKDKNEEEKENLALAVSETREKTNMIPAIVVMSLVFIITILGFINWQANFGIEVFDKLHESIYSASIKDVPIMQYILGSTTTSSSGSTTEAVAFGYFLLRTVEIVLILASALMALLYRLKLNEVLSSAYEGAKKMFKPVLYYFGASVAFLVVASSPFTFTLTNWLLNAVDGFNPYLTTFTTAITSIFHLDAGFTSYGVGSFLTAAYNNDFNLVHTIYLSISNLVHVIAPTSIFMVIGLSLMNVDYKSWFKYIWLFILGMLVILLVLFTVL